jgi:hypothetical protein
MITGYLKKRARARVYLFLIPGMLLMDRRGLSSITEEPAFIKRHLKDR